MTGPSDNRLPDIEGKVLDAARGEHRASGAPSDRWSDPNDREFLECTALLAAVLVGLLLIVRA